MSVKRLFFLSLSPSSYSWGKCWVSLIKCHEMTFVVNWRSTNKDVMSQLLKVTDLLHVFVGHRLLFHDKNHQIVKNSVIKVTWNFDNSLHRQNALYEGTEAVFSICALTLSVQLDRTQKAILKQETSQIDSQIVVRTEPTLPSLKKTINFLASRRYFMQFMETLLHKASQRRPQKKISKNNRRATAVKVTVPEGLLLKNRTIELN